MGKGNNGFFILEINAEQLDILWDCLSTDACGRELLHKWLLDQLKSQTQHALNMELLNYVLTSKVRFIIFCNFVKLTLLFCRLSVLSRRRCQARA